ncbi:MAG: hypothetical protein ABIE68_02130 [bacterium]
MLVTIIENTPKIQEKVVAEPTTTVPTLGDVTSTFWGYIAEVWWLLLPLFLFSILWKIWIEYKKDAYEQSMEYINLAIDVPDVLDIGPEAIEQIFAGIHGGIETNPNIIEKYWEGKRAERISFEITGIDGFIRFVVRLPEYYRDLVEAQIYAQYPDAQISETPDYTENMPTKFPDDNYDMFACDFQLTKEDAYPIKTYKDFMSQDAEIPFNDPLNSLTEGLSKLSQGEQVWLQIVARPKSDDWHDDGVKLAKKLIGAKVEVKQTGFDKAAEAVLIKPLHAAQKGLEGAVMGSEAEESSNSKDDPVSLMQFLSPGERNVVEALERNIAKPGFEIGFRFIYIAKKEVFKKPKGVKIVVGALKQFSSLDLNSFKMNKKTRTKLDYLFVEPRLNRRKRKMMRNFKAREMDKRPKPFILSTEELATLYHFPFSSVKAPMVPRTESRKSQPPIELPLEDIS